MKLEVGQTVYFRYLRTTKENIQQMKVSKIARKYFYVESAYGEGKYSLETGYECVGENYSPRWKAYESLQAIEDEKRREEEQRVMSDLRLKIYQKTSSDLYQKNLTLDQLRRIDAIVGEGKNG